MTATALRGTSDQMGNWTESPATPSEIRREERDRRALVREWSSYAESLGLRSRSARRLVGFYISHIEGTFDFYDWVIQYLDPTGETAVRNVMHERSRA